MKRGNNLKIEYVALIIAYIFIFVCMPSLHCHFQYLDWTPHCFHCHGHITNVEVGDNDTCNFCPVINFNSNFIPYVIIISLIICLVCRNIKENILIFNNVSKDTNLTRGPPKL